MKVIITGANGFLGSHLKLRFDDVITIPHQQISTFNIPDFDYFFFCSSYGNLASQTDGNSIFKANVGDLLDVYQKIKDKKFKAFIFLSSSSVKLRRQTTYSRSKKAAEEISLAVMERYNLPIAIVRPFSITGKGEQEEHLIPTLIRSCLKGEKMNFVPNPTHDFINVEDVVDGLISLAEHQARGIFELGTGVKTSNKQVLEMVEKLTNKKANINTIKSLREYDSEDWVSTNFKARMFGWLPIRTLEQSIQEMVYAN